MLTYILTILTYLPYLQLHTYTSSFLFLGLSWSGKETTFRESESPRLRESELPGGDRRSAVGGWRLAVGGHRRSTFGDRISESRYAYFTYLTYLTGAFSYFGTKQVP